MLFIPWRNEATDLRDRYNRLKSVIDIRKGKYENNTCEIDKAVEDTKKEAVLQKGYEIIASNAEHIQQKEQSLPTSDSQLYASFNPGNI